MWRKLSSSLISFSLAVQLNYKTKWIQYIKIVLNKKKLDRANTAQKKARDIEETGITGAYDAEFTEILNMLDQVNNAYNANPEDGLKDFINTIECVVFLFL